MSKYQILENVQFYTTYQIPFADKVPLLRNFVDNSLLPIKESKRHAKNRRAVACAMKRRAKDTSRSMVERQQLKTRARSINAASAERGYRHNIYLLHELKKVAIYIQKFAIPQLLTLSVSDVATCVKLALILKHGSTKDVKKGTTLAKIRAVAVSVIVKPLAAKYAMQCALVYFSMPQLYVMAGTAMIVHDLGVYVSRNCMKGMGNKSLLRCAPSHFTELAKKA